MNPEDPFAAVRIKKSQELPQTQKTPSQDPFSEVRIKKSQEFPGIYETGRHAARIGSRIAETIGGIPGDVSKLIESGIFSGLGKLTGYPLSQEQKEGYVSERPPTSQELKKASEKVTGGFTSPQSETEKVIDEYAETVTSLLGPMKFRKALGVGLASNLAKQGIKIAGGGEQSQEIGKLGSLFLASMYNPRGALQYATSQYQKANELSKGASIGAKQLQSNLSNLVKELNLGVTTPSKNAVIKPAEDLLAKISNGNILVQDLTAAKRDLNTLMKDPSLLQREKTLLKTVGSEIDKAIKPYEAINPEFSKAYRPANEIYGTVMQSKKASDFINKTLGGGKSILGSLILEASLGRPELLLPTASAAAGVVGGAKTIDFLSRIMKSSELRKYYADAVQAALKEDSLALIKANEKLEKKLQGTKISSSASFLDSSQ